MSIRFTLFAPDEDSPAYLEFAMLHELLHALGMTPACAPNHHRAGHTSDSNTDLMYAGDQPWFPSVLDLGNDDYWRHGNGDCVDLADSAFLDPTPADASLPLGW